jgi:hypothetical protein
LPQDHRNESGRQEDKDAVFTLVCEDEIVKQPLAGSAAQSRRILERNDIVDRLGFVIKRRLKLLFVDEVQLMSKEQRALALLEQSSDSKGFQEAGLFARRHYLQGQLVDDGLGGQRGEIKPMNASAHMGKLYEGITLVAAFSVKGLVAYDLVVGSFKTAKYLAFLQKLRILNGQECIGLFYDGSNVHKSAAAQQKLQQYQWLRLLNVAHS